MDNFLIPRRVVHRIPCFSFASAYKGVKLEEIEQLDFRDEQLITQTGSVKVASNNLTFVQAFEMDYLLMFAYGDTFIGNFTDDVAASNKKIYTFLQK
ncbi:hypothetical protein AAGS61_20695 [Lysinibacillus sp. KU-BSD001]|uniref:hypothetical protein n=1 Tax=Lysinibacillus sp. KU-BSD001 TaxID=3141328 RepID=UPI0036E1DA9A